MPPPSGNRYVDYGGAHIQSRGTHIFIQLTTNLIPASMHHEYDSSPGHWSVGNSDVFTSQADCMKERLELPVETFISLEKSSG